MTGERTPIVAATPETIAAAARAIQDGQLVAFPTETVYGLGADATNEDAVARLFAAKDRPAFNPLIVHVADAEAAAAVARVDGRARTLAGAVWPGALTVVLPRLDGQVSTLVSAGLETLAVRVPNHPVALGLLADAGVPVAAPSANASGRVSPTAAGHVAVAFPGPDRGGPAMVLDGGPCRVGIESTVVDLSGERPAVLRPGGVTVEAIEARIGPLAPVAGDTSQAEARKSPGMLARHYAPSLPLRLDAREPRPGEAFLAFGPDAPADVMNLSPSGDLEEAAANLFSMIRTLDGP
ncbi:MAG: L-threonylcarbamoyladenylate synthase, partial [Rhodospirillales bacterium]